ncbi:hybrid sensor histidine kinase/response regulator transcription factor [Adhaeribacter radiodurans]|uniref:histidine kinase n=1 Tax=Adhaeribacter radiodurans TaxID=2745197 RepID=A0A7L7L6K5_9BACT|nr:hybrid sensor histidine kinase/response regulator transcription factor [Adhaeribacter radiodurans]QMU28145.1 response regulator [Adhaeribacter radiodurans]
MLPLWAQDITFENVTLPPGSDPHDMFDIRQDPQGYLWVATTMGLMRYNGYNWSTYQHDPKNTHSLINDNVKTVCPTRDGLVWVGTWGMGLDCLDPETGKVTHHQLVNRKDYNYGENHIACILEDRKGNLWVGAKSGLYRRDAKTGRFVHYASRAQDSTSLSHPQVNVIYEDQEGTLWIGTGDPEANQPLGGGLNKLDPQTGRFTRYLHQPTNVHSLVDNRILALFEDSRGTFWVGTAGNGLHTMDRKKGQFTRFPYQENHPEKLSRPYSKLKEIRETSFNGFGIRFIVEDPTGAIWIGTYDGGANRFEPTSGRVTHFETPADGLPDYNLLSAYRTREGVLWMGTLLGHLIKVVTRPKLITRVNTSSGVHIFREDSAGTLWMGTISGLIAREPVSTSSRAWLRQISEQTSLLTDHVTRLDPDQQGNWWISTWRNGLYCYQPADQRFIHYQHDSLQTASLSPGEVIGVYQDRSGTRWVPTKGGLDRIDDLSGQFTHYRHDPNDSTSISASSCLQVLEDHTGAFWVATNGGGLNLLDRATGKFTLTNIPRWEVITQLLEDASGTLWVSASSGLYRYDQLGKRFLPFLDPGSGKTFPFVRALLEDNGGNLWAATPNGIVAIDTPRDSLRWFGANYGIPPGEDIFFGSRYKSRDGTLFFGSMDKYFHFRPEALLKSRPIPPMLVLSALRVRNHLVTSQPNGPLRESLAKAATIHLAHDQSIFSLDFVAIDYRHPDQHLYTYRLENYDLGWRPVSSERTANYYNVPPGEHRFRIRAANSDGIWVEKEVMILIAPPWWRTTWAYALYVLAFAGIFYGGWQTLLGRERAKNKRKLTQLKAEQLLEIERLKSRFFANISHELRTPLTLILSPLEKKLRTLEANHPDQADFRLMQRNGQRLLHLVNQLLDLSKLEAGKMKLETQQGDLVPFFHRITDAFASLAEDRKIHFTVLAPAESRWVSFDADKLEKILNNLLSNAFKFTLAHGEVTAILTLKFSLTPLILPSEKVFLQAEFTVQDTGIGISPQQLELIFDRFHQVDNSLTREQEGTGIGLSLTRELVELHEGTIVVNSEPGKGSQFVVTLPLELVPLWKQDGTEPAQEESYPAFNAIPIQRAERVITKEVAPLESNHQVPLVLVVEDNADLRQFISQSLTEFSFFEVIEAINGVEGLHQALEHIPDLIISDIMMPQMDGIALCHKLKTDEKTSHIPIVLLTAKASGDSKVEGLETGADDYLTKPFQLRELMVRLHNLIEGRRKLRERYSRQVRVQPKDIAITSADERFLTRAMVLLEQHIGEVDFSVERLGKEIGMSRMQLYRKLQALTGQSPSDFIKTMRLQYAAQLLVKNSGTVSEISYQVGFSSHSYFSKCFAEQYGRTPSEYVADQAPTS